MIYLVPFENDRGCPVPFGGRISLKDHSRYSLCALIDTDCFEQSEKGEGWARHARAATAAELLSRPAPSRMTVQGLRRMARAEAILQEFKSRPMDAAWLEAYRARKL